MLPSEAPVSNCTAIQKILSEVLAYPEKRFVLLVIKNWN